MEQQITQREPREWDAQSYAQGNWIQEKVVLQFLQETGIDFKNKKILDIGCGTGNISRKIAKTAKHVHGIDASKNMIEYAKKTYNTRNLTFEHVFAEDFTSTEQYNIIVSFYCLHWIEDQGLAFKNINAALEKNGDFFGTVHITSADQEPLRITALREMIPQLSSYSFFQDRNIIEDMNAYALDEQTFKNLFRDNGFELIPYEKKSIQQTITNREELEAFQTPIIMSRPIVQLMPYLLRQWFFKTYIDILEKKLKQNERGHYIVPMSSTIFHARKIAELQ
jgi:2-polyprenyl-3-methyl-5-hydroxy-6-metoxy-1,4-benzoquinol methylase